MIHFCHNAMLSVILHVLLTTDLHLKILPTKELYKEVKGANPFEAGDI